MGDKRGRQRKTVRKGTGPKAQLPGATDRQGGPVETVPEVRIQGEDATSKADRQPAASDVDARPAATDAETKPAGVQARAVGGRPKGVKDTKARKPREPKVEPIVEDIITALKAVARDPDFLKRLKERAKEGRLLPGEMRLLIDVSRQVDEKPKDKVLMDYATPVERWVILNVARRAKAEPEIGFRLPGTVRDTTLAELCELAAKLPGLGRKNPTAP